MNVSLTKSFTFEAAHRLPKMPQGHKCRRLHGHSFGFSVTVEGPVDDETGLLLDYADIERAVEPARKVLDHQYLNEIDGLENPTSEILALWLWKRIQPNLPQLSEIAVRESCTSTCILRRDNTPQR